MDGNTTVVSRYIEYERRVLPIALICNPITKKRTMFHWQRSKKKQKMRKNHKSVVTTMQNPNLA